MLIFGGADGLLILTYLQELNKQGSSNWRNMMFLK
jgi:hypothetical protein